MKYVIVLVAIAIVLVINGNCSPTTTVVDVETLSTSNSTLDDKSSRQKRYWTFGELIGVCAGKNKMCGPDFNGKDCCGDLTCLYSPENGARFCVFDASVAYPSGYFDNSGLTGYGF